MLKFRIHFTDAKEAVLPFRQREESGDVFWKGLLLILLMGRKGLEQLSDCTAPSSSVSQVT